MELTLKNTIAVLADEGCLTARKIVDDWMRGRTITRVWTVKGGGINWTSKAENPINESDVPA